MLVLFMVGGVVLNELFVGELLWVEYYVCLVLMVMFDGVSDVLVEGVVLERGLLCWVVDNVKKGILLDG